MFGDRYRQTGAIMRLRPFSIMGIDCCLGYNNVQDCARKEGVRRARIVRGMFERAADVDVDRNNSNETVLSLKEKCSSYHVPP